MCLRLFIIPGGGVGLSVCEGAKLVLILVSGLLENARLPLPASGVCWGWPCPSRVWTVTTLAGIACWVTEMESAGVATIWNRRCVRLAAEDTSGKLVESDVPRS